MEVAVEGLAELRRETAEQKDCIEGADSHRAWTSGETQSLYSQAAAVSLDQTFHSLVHLLEKSCHFLSKLVLHSARVTIRFASSEHF